MRNHFNQSLDESKKCGRFDDCPEFITDEYMIEAIGKDKDGLAQHVYGTCDLFNEEQLRLHQGLSVDLEHLNCRWFQLALTWAKSFKELCQLHHFTAIAAMPCQGNYAKGNLPVGELRRRLDINGNFIGWYAKKHFSPTIHSIERVVANINVSYYEEFARNGGSDSVYLKGAVLAFNKTSRSVKYRYNTETRSIEEVTSTVVGNAVSALSVEIEATLGEFLAKFSEIDTFNKTWMVDVNARCATNPNVTQSTYLVGKFSIYIDDEAGQQCSYFSNISINRNITIASASDQDFVLGTRKGKGYKRLSELLKKQTELLDYYRIHVDNTRGGPLSNAATIYIKRVILCILANYYTDEQNQRWRILKKSGNEYVEAAHVEAFKYLKDKYDNEHRKKKCEKNKQDKDDNNDDEDEDGIEE
jgi:hypothetical protein